jgi:hypothetical protein
LNSSQENKKGEIISERHREREKKEWKETEGNVQRVKKERERDKYRKEESEKGRKEIETGRKLKMKVTQRTKLNRIGIMVIESNILISHSNCHFITLAEFEMRHHPPLAESVDLCRSKLRD